MKTKKIVNRNAYRLYRIEEKMVAGMALTGAETKSIRTRGIELGNAFVRIKDNQAYLVNANIHPYPYARHEDFEPTRERKLLLKEKFRKLKIIDEFDNGIDLKGKYLITSTLSIPTIVRILFTTTKIRSEYIKDFQCIFNERRNLMRLVISNSGYTKRSQKQALKNPRVYLIKGSDLVDMVQKNKFSPLIRKRKRN